MHTQSSEFAGKNVKIKSKSDNPLFDGQIMQVQDWWDIVHKTPWALSNGSVACLCYAVRTAGQESLTNDDVLVGMVNGYEHLVHISEVAEVIP